MTSSTNLRVPARTARPQLLVLLLLLLVHLTPASAQDSRVADITRVSGCMDVGMATDNCTGGTVVTIYGSNFDLISNYQLARVSFYPDDYLSIYQSRGGITNFTSTSMLALLHYPYPVTAALYQWHNVSVGSTGADSALLTGIRYATLQTPYITRSSCTSDFCDSYSTVAVQGYYLNVVTAVSIVASVNTQTTPNVHLFTVACTNLSLLVQAGTSLGTYYNLTCQLPQLTYTDPSYRTGLYYYPKLLLTLVSPYGNSSNFDVLQLNRTHNSAQSLHPATHITLLLGVLLAVLVLSD